MAASVDFLEKMKQLQDVHFESEQKRLQLEQELNSYVKSDSRMARLKAVRLQNYWKKICEDEKRSAWRNDQLLQDFDRVESHMAELSARTERLRVMKKQYEEYIERTYPQWKERVVFMKQQREQLAARPPQQPPVSVYVDSPSPAAASAVDLPGPAAAPPAAAAPLSHGLQFVSQAARNAQLSTESRLVDVRQPLLQQQQQQQQQLAPQPQPSQYAPSQAATPAHQAPPHHSRPSHHHLHAEMDPHYGLLSPGEAPVDYLAVPSAGSTLQTISSLPTGTSLTSIQARAKAAAAAAAATGVTPNQSADFSAAGQTWESTDLESVTAGGGGALMTSGLTSVLLETEQSVDVESEEFMSPKEATVRPVSGGQRGAGPMVTIPDAGGSGKVTDGDTLATEGSTTHRSPRGEDVFDDEDSLPLSPHELVSTNPLSVQSGTLTGGLRSRQNSQSSILDDKSEERSIYPEADVTLAGLYNLFDAVQEVLTTTRQGKEFYRTGPPPASVRADIIENGNKGQMLSHVDPTSVSMVIREQLPLVVQNCEGGALVPDSYIYRPRAESDYDSIRLQVHPTSVGFWDRLCEHFVALVRYGIMAPAEVGDVFGPLVISEDSPYEDRAKTLLTGMLEGVEVVDPTSPTSTASLSSMLTPKVTQPRPKPTEEVPPLDLPPSKSEDDDFYRRPRLADPGASLTQTAAYRQLLGHSTQAVGDYEDSEDDADDIERQITKSITSPRPKSSLGRPAAAPPAPPSAAAAVSTAGPAGDAVSSDDSPRLSPTSPPAYVPSALTSTGLSTMTSMSSTGKMAKKPGFRFGDSDTDEDIDLGGTGSATKSLKHGEEKDDFDFYD